MMDSTRTSVPGNVAATCSGILFASVLAGFGRRRILVVSTTNRSKDNDNFPGPLLAARFSQRQPLWFLVDTKCLLRPAGLVARSPADLLPVGAPFLGSFVAMSHMESFFRGPLHNCGCPFGFPSKNKT